jgi:hypothetical protein
MRTERNNGSHSQSRKAMSNSADTVDSVAVILLCLVGLASNLPIWVAGSPKFGVLSTVWQKVGIGTLVACSLSSLLIAALILRRIYRVASSRPYGLLSFVVVSAIPSAFFVAILAVRFVHGE